MEKREGEGVDSDQETRRVSLWNPVEELADTEGSRPFGTLKVQALGGEVVFSSEQENEDLEAEVSEALRWAGEQQKLWAGRATLAQRKLRTAEHFLRMVRKVGRTLGMTDAVMREASHG